MNLNKWIALAVVKVLVLALGIGVVFSIYGCNTVRGMGQDIEQAGAAIKKSTQ